MKIIFALSLIALCGISAFEQTKAKTAAHTHDILAVKFSPDDSQLISYSWGDGKLILWDVKSGYLLWYTRTEFVEKADERYNLQEFYWSADGKSIVTKSENATYQAWDAATGKIQAVYENRPEIVLFEDKPRPISVSKDYSNFYLLDSRTGSKFTLKQFSRTGTTYDVSHDGTLFAEGGSWGNAAIKITELSSQNSRLLDGKLSKQPESDYEPSELETKLTNEKRKRLAIIATATFERGKQADIDLPRLVDNVFVTFEHYGDMTDPGELRMAESSQPSRSKVSKDRKDATAVWLRLHNESSLPITIPTQSMYLPDSKCFYQFPSGPKVNGLCDNSEIYVWHGLENKKGESLRYGFDFGSSATLLPKTSVLFPVPLSILKDGNAIRFRYRFLNANSEKVEDYGESVTIKFREGDIPKPSLQGLKSTLLPVSEAKALTSQCSRPGPSDFSDTWEPNASQINEMEARLDEITNLKVNSCCIVGHEIQKPGDWYRQYIGLIWHGRKIIYISAVSTSTPEYKSIKDGMVIPDWTTVPVQICGGGSAWGVIYDIGTRNFSELTVNGVG